MEINPRGAADACDLKWLIFQNISPSSCIQLFLSDNLCIFQSSDPSLITVYEII